MCRVIIIVCSTNNIGPLNFWKDVPSQMLVLTLGASIRINVVFKLYADLKVFTIGVDGTWFVHRHEVHKSEVDPPVVFATCKYAKIQWWLPQDHPVEFRICIFICFLRRLAPIDCRKWVWHNLWHQKKNQLIDTCISSVIIFCRH